MDLRRAAWCYNAIEEGLDGATMRFEEYYIADFWA